MTRSPFFLKFRATTSLNSRWLTVRSLPSCLHRRVRGDPELEELPLLEVRERLLDEELLLWCRFLCFFFLSLSFFFFFLEPAELCFARFCKACTYWRTPLRSSAP